MSTTAAIDQVEGSSEAKALAVILAWSQECPEWQRDALRRLCGREKFEAEDLESLLLICKGDEEGDPVTADHVRDPAAFEVEVVLSKLHNLKHVNALQPGETLTFQKSGLTVIYGDNGAGKSGYARVLKQACRARLPKGDVVLPNIYSAETGTPTAEVAFRVGGQNRSVVWKQNAPADANLTAVSVFDSRTAAVHVDATNELAYTPLPLKIMAALADACQVFKTKLAAEIKILQEQTPAVLKEPKCAPDTAVGRLLTKFSVKTTAQQVEELAGLSEAEEVRLKALDADFSTDPARAARQLQALKTKVEKAAERLTGLARAVRMEKAEHLRSLKEALDTARAAAVLASADLFSGEPLPKVGSDVWRSLWEAARRYSNEDAYPDRTFPITDGEARCVLCHQELSAEASDRLGRFEAFVLNESKNREDEASKSFQEAWDLMVEARIPMSDMRAIIAVIRDDLDDPDLAVAVRRSCVANAWRLRMILRTIGATNRPVLPSEVAVPVAEMSAHPLDLERRAAALLAEKDSPERKALVAERDELAARRWFGLVKDDVLAQIERLKAIGALNKAQKTTATNRITSLSTDLAKTLVTNRLRARFVQEVDKLGVAGLAIELQQTRSSAGIPFFHVRLISKPDEPVGKVLSEGEHRCVALAAFMAELSTIDTFSGIVFDDPVSSLDHIHRDKVAARLAAESLKRQVIIFTHDIAFLVLLEEACRATQTRAAIPLGYRVISRGAEAAGFCNSEPPANVLPVAKVVPQMRKHLANVRIHYDRGDQANWRREVGSFEKELREAWERAVEDVVSPVIKRLSQKVNTNGLTQLTVLTGTDCTGMREAYGRCSQLLHSQPGEVNPRLPSPADIEAEITALETWITDIRGRQETALIKGVPGVPGLIETASS